MAEEKAKKETRRSFLQKLGIGTILLAFAGNVYSWFRSFVPNVLYEPLRKFKIGTPKNLPDGVKVFEEEREFVIREKEKIHAISAICTHLGCTVKYVQLAKPKKVVIDGKEVEVKYEFHCPCHGSKFYADGTNYAGPAPTPLPWHKVDLSPDDGQIVVDTSTVVKKGTYWKV